MATDAIKRSDDLETRIRDALTPLHPENLGKVSIGELVVFTHTEGVAVSVEKVVAKKK